MQLAIQLIKQFQWGFTTTWMHTKHQGYQYAVHVSNFSKIVL